MAMDAAVAFSVGRESFSDGSGQLRVMCGICVALYTLLALCILGGYKDVLRRGWMWHSYSLAVIAITTALGVGLGTTSGMITLQRTQVCRMPAVLFLALLAMRFLLLQGHRSLLVPKRLWVIADSAALGKQLARTMRDQAAFYRVVRISGAPTIEELRRTVEEIDAVLATSAMRAWLQPLCNIHGKELLVSPNPSDVLLRCAEVHPVGDGVVLSMPALGTRGARRICKRMVDALGAGALLVFFLPLMLALYFLIPRGSQGKAIYRQTRRGLRGSSFDILKFRTMTNDAEESTGPVFARRQDHRITRLGKILRATRLDELPQLVNVLKGEMSLVGPRPERECFARRFDQALPDYPLRTLVKPGLTGLAQVSGSYSTSAEDKLRLDLWYISNQSLWLDLQLLLHTGRVVLHREKAAGVEGEAQPAEITAAHRSIRRASPSEAFSGAKPVFLRSKP
jgi:exopolysaccharide biosynthesis polyprenyl glycosylphosphotransferase